MPSVTPPADNREVVDLDQPAKKGKKKGIEPTAGCSTCPSIDVADGETQCQTCIVDEEFAESEAQEYPNVKPGSALWRLHRREYDRSYCVARQSIVDRVFPEARPPMWHEGLPAFSEVPFKNAWNSPSASVVLANHKGKESEHGTVQVPRLQATLMQQMTDAEPYVAMRRFERSAEGHYTHIRGSSYFLRLPEATELAHLLLLFVDVARESGAA